jgi:hypothetical protein
MGIPACAGKEIIHKRDACATSIIGLTGDGGLGIIGEVDWDRMDRRTVARWRQSEGINNG